MLKTLVKLMISASIIATSAVQAAYDNKKIPAADSILIDNKGKQVGTVLLREGPDGVLVNIKVRGLSPGKHGTHFHTVGSCEDTAGFLKSKGHIDPNGLPHGYLNYDGGPHEGDLPNIIASSDGSAEVEFYSTYVSFYGNKSRPAIFDEDGSALIIHAMPDDHVSQPIGGSGARVVCGVFKAEAAKHHNK